MFGGLLFLPDTVYIICMPLSAIEVLYDLSISCWHRHWRSKTPLTM